MGLYLVEVYRSPNIGIFLRANDRFLLAPKGIASTKSRMLAENLGVSPVFVSVEGTRLLGPLIAMNNKGMLVSRMVEDYEVKEIASQTGLRVEKFRLEVHGRGEPGRGERQRGGRLPHTRPRSGLPGRGCSRR